MDGLQEGLAPNVGKPDPMHPSDVVGNPAQLGQQGLGEGGDANEFWSITPATVRTNIAAFPKQAAA
jgi:hypothetical protein